MPARKVAALYVDEKGIYSNLPHVEVWGLSKDARNYSGPYPIVAHPPCQRWGNLWMGSPKRGSKRHRKGDDGGCFESVLEKVRTYGGIIEHPRNSSAWEWFGIKKPYHLGGWMLADTHGGWTCCVEQCNYGHLAAKPTWLYAYNVETPKLKWGLGHRTKLISSLGYGNSSGILFDESEIGKRTWKDMSTKQREKTPVEFRDLLISIAQTAGTVQRPQTLFPIS